MYNTVTHACHRKETREPPTGHKVCIENIIDCEKKTGADNLQIPQRKPTQETKRLTRSTIQRRDEDSSHQFFAKGYNLGLGLFFGRLAVTVMLPFLLLGCALARF